ncbi:MAG: RNA 2',3'-cyclic phosphodiesterase [Methylophilaceae bacterium]
MPRLFVAVDLPAAVAAKLAGNQPPPMAGMRRVEPGQMHLTLHYIGEANIERIAAALRAVAVPAFSLTLEGVGRFHSTGKAVTLWAGVSDNAELLGLHAAIAAALAVEGYRPEARHYSPHITLARCKSVVPAGVVAEFLARHAAFALPGVPVTAFGLYSSTLGGDAPVYRRERSFPLLAAGGVS